MLPSVLFISPIPLFYSEQHDCEIAQEIQEKLTIEAERRRIQEKKDEDIARLLQEKEL